MTATKIIRWTNKYSHEQGYVKTINKKERYFENTFERDEARHFQSKESVLSETIRLLEEYCGDNTYEALEV